MFTYHDWSMIVFSSCDTGGLFCLPGAQAAVVQVTEILTGAL